MELEVKVSRERRDREAMPGWLDIKQEEEEEENIG